MIRQILGNQKGMSLVEVIVASVISIIIAMGVMKINETSQQGLKSIEVKSELLTVKNGIQGVLMSPQKCMAGDGSGNNLADLDLGNWGGLTTATDMTPPMANPATFNKYALIDTLYLTTGPGGDGDYSTTGDNTKITIANGSPLPGAEANWTVTDSVRVYPNPNDGSGMCYLMIHVSKRVAAASMGGETKNMWFAVKCDIDFGGDNKLKSCSGSNTVAEGLLQDNGDGSYGTGEDLILTGNVQIGGTYDATETAALTVTGDTLWVNGDLVDEYQAIGLANNQVLTFGNTDQSGIWSDGLTTTLSSTEYVTIKSTNQITLEAGVGAEILLNALGGPINLQPGGGSNIELMGPTHTSGDFTVDGGGRIIVNGGSSVSIDGGGGLSLTAGSNASIDGGSLNITNGGASISSGGLAVNAGGIIVTGGDIDVNGGAMSINNGGGLTVTGGGNTTSVLPVTVRSPTFSFPNGAELDNNTNGTIATGQKIFAAELLAPNHWGTNYYYFSDERFKKEIQTIEHATEKLSELRGVTYFLRKDEFPEKNFDDTLQVGLIAQEVELIFPELVYTAESGYKSVKYANLVAVLIEGFKENLAEIKKNREMIKLMQEGIARKDKEQDVRIEALENENNKLRSELNELKDEVKQLNQKLDKLLMRKED